MALIGGKCSLNRLVEVMKFFMLNTGFFFQPGSFFGYSVSTANNAIGVGAPLDGTATQGAAYVFIRDRIFADGFDG